LGPYEQIVRGWLTADLEVPRKQRHTARRVWQRLVAEHGANVAESTVRAFVASVRAEVAGGVRVVTIGQVHAPGDEGEVDFGEFIAIVGGVRMKLNMFCMRLSASSRGFHVAFAHQAQEAFLEGHRLGFEDFGGVPRRIRYDNLKAAVIKVLAGRDRVENDRFIALRSHYGFESFFCMPGIDGAHEKGGVEGEVGRFRRRHLVPVPRVESLVELNALFAAADRLDDSRRVGRRAMSIGEAFTVEADHLRALPVEEFGCFTELTAKVDTKARICVRQSWYSVPARFAGRRVVVRLHADRLEVLDGGTVIAAHPRSLHKGSEDLVLDHYLEVLVRKPGALAGSIVLAQARTAGAFTVTHQQFWDTARRAHGDGPGTAALCKVLLLHRTMSGDLVRAGISGALAVGSTDPEVVAVEARAARDLLDARGNHALVIAIRAARTAAPLSPAGQRPPPSLGGYDDLLAAGATR
jgi:transposase